NDAIVDTRNANSKISWIATPWINTNNTHGTGCSLSSALAAVRPLVDSWEEAAKSVKSWMNKALSSGSALQVGTVGKGHGPIDHLIQIAPVNFLSTARRITSDIEDKITNTTFFEQLIDGDMELKRFANYLAQDNCYLSDYGSLLDKAANLAPNQSEKNFFKNLANIGTEDELRMHDEWHKSNGFSNLARNSKGEINLSLASKVTNGYINHLRLAAVKDDYEILISALLPCIFLYGEMVSGLKKKIDPEKLNNNIFKNWIELYADPENVKISLQMSEIVNKNAESVNQEKWTEMLKVYRKSAELEFEFFEQ
ncbi:MAG: bifunctional hydroxymethylpyrimidine kinase/phosphomethylpyrimidine kinase, partial [Candidatus Ancillula sp.]|nr:bifunctional hydroxymethylpyrimidine kinase/phosphomethylpyrimidine kinase [Candidatus Ancillula sp.]